MALRFSGVLIVCMTPACVELPELQTPPNADLDTLTTGSMSVFPDDSDPTTASLAFDPAQLLVSTYPGADAAARDAEYERAGARRIDRIEELDIDVLEVFGDSLAATAEALLACGLIESVHKNYFFEAQQVSNDPMVSDQAHLEQVGVSSAWGLTVGSRDMVIAIVDTGVQPDHPDLIHRIADGWNVYDNNADFADVRGHGTMVAGVVGATSDNAIGVAGVTWDNPLLAVRVTDRRGRTTSRHLAAGILWAVGHGARVINVSFAPLWSNAVVRSAAQQAWNRGALVVISTGNAGVEANSPGYAEGLFVGAVDEADQVSLFSNRGRFVDLVAPGTEIQTTALGSRYRTTTGTSFAAPIVAGVAALAWSINPGLRPVTITQALEDTAVDAGPSGKDTAYGLGIVDAAAAIRRASETTFIPDISSPRVNIETPTAGASLTGRVVVAVEATDPWGVADVVMSIDGVAVASDSRGPYRFVVNTSNFSSGGHELTFQATDLAGNRSAAVAVAVTFLPGSEDASGRSAVVFHSPPDASVVFGDVDISATVTSDKGLATIEWLIDGQTALVQAISGESSRLSFRWSSDETEAGNHTITLIATDASGGRRTGTLSLTTR
jgi:subtilisin family serine protease